MNSLMDDYELLEIIITDPEKKVSKKYRDIRAYTYNATMDVVDIMDTIQHGNSPVKVRMWIK